MTAPTEPKSEERRGSLSVRGLVIFAWTVPAVVAMLLVLFALQFPMAKALAVLSTALLVGGAAFIAGSLVGFLFGIPRSAPSEAPPSSEEVIKSPYSVNTNLEQISDWLTKILVGVGLVQLGSAIDRAPGWLAALSQPFGDMPNSPAVAGAVILSFTVWGFLVSYLLTRTSLTATFKAYDLSEVVKLAADRALTTVNEESEQRAQADALALRLGGRQLNVSSVDEPVSFTALVQALKAASAPVREQLLLEAQSRRRAAWQWADEHRTEVRDDMRARHSRALKLLKALVEAYPDNPRARTELGYALKDDAEPDLAGAFQQLTTALTMSSLAGDPVDWIHLNRAIAGIRLQRGGGRVSADQIESDLRSASTGRPRVRGIVTQDEEIKQWCAARGVQIVR